jgi:hypothetical protein
VAGVYLVGEDLPPSVHRDRPVTVALRGASLVLEQVRARARVRVTRLGLGLGLPNPNPNPPPTPTPTLALT